MALEPYTAQAVYMTVLASLIVSSAIATAKWARDGKRSAEKAVRILQGEDDVEDTGLVEKVEDNRRALLYAGAYPPDTSDDLESDPEVGR